MIPAWVGDVLTPVEKLDVHRRGLRHKAISVFINCGDQTLLQRRALGKYHTPGLWANACCTHPHWDEAPTDCAVRRLDEELNITGLTPELRGHVHYRADVGNDLTEDEEVDIFVIEVAKTFDVNPNPEEAMDVAWRRFDEIADDMKTSADRYTPWLRIYFERHDHIFRG